MATKVTTKAEKKGRWFSVGMEVSEMLTKKPSDHLLVIDDQLVKKPSDHLLVIDDQLVKKLREKAKQENKEGD